MKKLVAISVLLVFLTAAVFAQFTVGIVADFYPDLLKATSPIGDDADENNVAYNGQGTFDFFSSSNTFKDDSELRFNFKYVAPEEKYGGELAINADALIARGDSFLGGTTNVIDILSQAFGDWNVWGKVGVLKGLVGNTADRGAAGNMRYNDAFSIFFDNMQVSNYGILGWGGTIDTFNLRAYPTEGAIYTTAGTPYVSITADLAPVKVAVAGDMSQVAFDETGRDSYNKVGAAVRVSGDKIADLVSFDAIYKIHGGDEQTDNNVINQPDNQGIWGHNFGLVANLSLLDSLGIGVGYSGYAVAAEKGPNTSDQKYVYPYFNGIDLRLEFTGVEKLIVDFNNNISFATINGSGDQNVHVVAPWGNFINGNASVDVDYSAAYLGLYNALGVKFEVSPELFVNFGIQNVLRTVTVADTDADTKGVETQDDFRALLGAGYHFGDHVLLETGLVFDLDSTVTELTNQNNYNGGTFTFAIPIRFKVELP